MEHTAGCPGGGVAGACVEEGGLGDIAARLEVEFGNYTVADVPCAGCEDEYDANPAGAPAADHAGIRRGDGGGGPDVA